MDDVLCRPPGEAPTCAVWAAAGRCDAVALFSLLGLAVHATKGAVTWTRQMAAWGFLIDTSPRTLLLPPKRLTKVLLSARALLAESASRRRWVGTRRMQRFCGLAMSTALADGHGGIYLGGQTFAGPGFDGLAPQPVGLPDPERRVVAVRRGPLCDGVDLDAACFQLAGAPPSLGRRRRKGARLGGTHHQLREPPLIPGGARHPQDRAGSGLRGRGFSGVTRPRMVGRDPPPGQQGGLPPRLRRVLHARRLDFACAAATLADGRPFVPRGRSSVAALEWRAHAHAAAVDGFDGLDGADEAARMLTNALADSTAAGYHRHWRRFAAYCAAQGCSALPAAPATVVCYLGTLLRGGRISPASLQKYLSPINTRHVDVGLPRPAVGRLIHSARVGFGRLRVRSVGALPLARRPLPAPVMWRIVELAYGEPDFGWRVRWAALMAGCLVARRTAEILGLERGDVTVTAAGGLHVQVRLYKGAERRTRLSRLVFDVPPSRDALPDLPLLVLRRLLADLDARRAPLSRLLFAPPGATRPPTADDVTAWLLAALRRLDLSPPPGVKWCSYSTRGGGATALHLCGLSPPAVAQMLGHNGNDPRTALAHYIDLLAPRSTEAWRLCGRYVP